MHVLPVTVALLCVALSSTDRLVAQPVPVSPPAATVPWFELGTTPVSQSGPARPGQYLAAVGRRAIGVDDAQWRGAPVDLEFAPALPLGANTSVAATDIARHAGDLHARVHARVAGTTTLRAPYTGGCSIRSTAATGARVGESSRHVRIVSERLADAPDAPYLVSLEGLAGQQAAFHIAAPSAESSTRLRAQAKNGATVTLAAASAGARRVVTVTFPVAGANADGYTTTELSFTLTPP